MKIAAAFVIACALAACAQQQTDADEGPAIAEKRLPLPVCADVAIGSGASSDCRIQSSDKAGLAFEVRRNEEAGITKETIAVVGPGDATLQTIVEAVDAQAPPPHLQDVDGDGRDELMVAISAGAANATFAIWRAAGDDPVFSRLGELTGASIGPGPGGAAAVSARSSAAEWIVEYYRINGETLNALARATVAAEAGEGGAIKTTCVAADAGAMTALGLTPEELQRRYCDAPLVAKIFD